MVDEPIVRDGVEPRRELRLRRVACARLDRASNAPAETVTIYYDSYRNLVARGIIQAPYGRRQPNPFPNATFAPDPWR